MNIFFLDKIPKICAQMHVSKHVVKMILETTQILCSAWHVLDPENKLYKPCYKLTHKNHPSCIWVREAEANYLWLCELGSELCKEYTYRYGKTHKCEKYIQDLNKHIPPFQLKKWTPPRCAMPDMYKSKDFIESYRQYYFFEKSHIHNWNGKINSRSKPQWIVEYHHMFNN